MERNEMLCKAQALCNRLYWDGEVDILPCVFIDNATEEETKIYREQCPGFECYEALYRGIAPSCRHHHIGLTDLLLEADYPYLVNTVLHECAHARHYEFLPDDLKIDYFYNADLHHNEVWEAFFEDFRIIYGVES